KMAVFADNRDRLRLVDIASGKTLFDGAFSCRGGIAFSPQEWILAVAPGDNTIALWDIPTLLASKTSKLPEPQSLFHCRGKVTAFVFSPDGKRLATVEEGKLCRLYEVASKQKLATIEPPGRSVFALAFSANGRFL